MPKRGDFVTVNGCVGVVVLNANEIGNEDSVGVWFGDFDDSVVPGEGPPLIWNIGSEHLVVRDRNEPHPFKEKLEQLCQRIQQITAVDLKHKSVFELLTSAAEELGELAQALKIEEKSYGNAHKKINESSASESVDLIICGLALFYARGGTDDMLRNIMSKKLMKWEANQR
jgi:hypothetical protein